MVIQLSKNVDLNLFIGGQMLSWIKKWWERVLLISLSVIVVGSSIFYYIRIKKISSDISTNDVYMKYFVQPSLNNISSDSPAIDFSNKSGVVRVRSGFADLLINSEGSVKKGEGYQISLKTINPSGLLLTGSKVAYSWYHAGQNQAVTIDNPNSKLYPGSSIRESAFLSPVEGTELKTIYVNVEYELMGSK